MGESDKSPVLAIPLWEVTAYDRDYDDRRGRWERVYLVSDKDLADRLVAANNAQLLNRFNSSHRYEHQNAQQSIAEHNALVAAGLRTGYEPPLPDYENIVPSYTLDGWMEVEAFEIELDDAQAARRLAAMETKA